MRTIIAGSRQGISYESFCEAMKTVPLTPTLVLCGMAPGVDSWALRWAEERHLPVEKYPADWGRYGSWSAGLIRNEQMAKNAEALILIWDGASSGSRHMLKKAIEHNLVIHDVIIGGNQ